MLVHTFAKVQLSVSVLGSHVQHYLSHIAHAGICWKSWGLCISEDAGVQQLCVMMPQVMCHFHFIRGVLSQLSVCQRVRDERLRGCAVASLA